MNNDQKLEGIRHSLAHLTVAAVRELWPGSQNAIGPAIENGFYQDFEIAGTVTDKDLPRIEAKMREILPTWTEFSRREVTPEEARGEFAWNTYKTEMIEDLAQKGEQITFYTCGNLVDLCRGGHSSSPAHDVNPEAFKLTHIAGAYWRGDEKNKMLTRIYGVAFGTKQELEAYEQMVEESKKRDHRKLGQELDLFTFSDLVGAGLPLFTPKGTVLRMELQNRLLEISRKYDMLPVTIPHIAKIDLYETSGHAGKFKDELFRVISHYNQEFVMKPVNCPHHTQIYASRPRSYRDLPLRYMESTMQYRDEKPGEIGGLTRVRAITVDDGHIFCRVDQIKNEAASIAKIIEEFYSSLGMYGNHWVSLSLRDPQHPENYIGDDEGWQQAEAMLQEVSEELGLNARRMEGEAALYGPKLDYMFKDSLGKERQLATIQIDFAMPKRFGLTYTDKDGTDKNPVIIHRAILGSYERFLAILIEHFAGAFPLWLSPVQVAVIPVSEKFDDYAQKVAGALKQANLRFEIKGANDTLGKRIREAQLHKTPYVLVLGEREETSGQVSVRSTRREDEKDTAMSVEEFIQKILQEINSRSL